MAAQAAPRAAAGVAVVFSTERASPFSTAGFRKLIARLGARAGIAHAHPHQLRHACGFKLANDGVVTRSLQAYLGHRNTHHTVRYTELAPQRVQELLAQLENHRTPISGLTARAVAWCSPTDFTRLDARTLAVFTGG